MICLWGWFPNIQAGKATLAMIDFPDLGGTQIIRRLHLPAAHSSSFAVRIERCGLSKNTVCGKSSANVYSTNVIKLCRMRKLKSVTAGLELTFSPYCLCCIRGRPGPASCSYVLVV